MLKRTCVQCGKEFEMSQSEISFYKKKKLSLPKRCKECRELNKSKKNKNKDQQEDNRKADRKADKQSKKAEKAKQSNQKDTNNSAENNKNTKKFSAGKKRLAYIAAAAIVVFGGGGTAISTMNDAPAEEVAIEQTVELEETSVGAELTGVVIEHEFRNDELLENHYKKHGIEMGFDSKEEYLAAANRVVASPDVLHKIEAEDGDDVYYLEETNEFVVISKDGYLRTYFNPSDGIDYFNRQ